MANPMRRDDWIDDDEYPSDEDVEAFGEDSPLDNDPRSIGYVGDLRPGFWTPTRIGILVVVLILMGVLLLPPLLRLL
jgi:hypothetical protein